MPICYSKNMVGVSVTKAVYQFEGNPSVDKPVTFEHDAVCGNCETPSQTAPAGKVLTSQFGSWDSIIETPEGGRWLCAACAWAYRAVPYRRTPAIITIEETGKGVGGKVRWASKADLVQVLSRPIPSHMALSIPLSGKKMVLPVAKWGMVATDTKVFRWSPRNHRQLQAALELRGMGTGEPALADPSPPYYLLNKTDPAQHSRIKELWDALRPIRDDKTMLPFIQNVSRKDKK